jgi:hypothetical protein
VPVVCPECHIVNPRTNKQCGYCGASLKPAVPMGKASRRKRTPRTKRPSWRWSGRIKRPSWRWSGRIKRPSWRWSGRIKRPSSKWSGRIKRPNWRALAIGAAALVGIPLFCILVINLWPGSSSDEPAVPEGTATGTPERTPAEPAQAVATEPAPTATPAPTQTSTRAPTAPPAPGSAAADRIVAYNPGPRAQAEYTDPEALLGDPDLVADPCCQGMVQLGKRGTVLLAFTDNSIVDGDGPDLQIFGEPTNDDYLLVEVSADGRTWAAFQRVTESPDPLDLADLGVDQAIYVRLTDRQPGTATGAELDAVVALNSSAGPGGNLPPLPDAVTRNDLTLRQEPRMAAGEVVTLPSGTELTLPARTGNARWVKLETGDGQSGWCRAFEVGLNIDLDDTPVEPVPTQPAPAATPSPTSAEQPPAGASPTPTPEPSGWLDVTLLPIATGDLDGPGRLS